MNRPRRPFGWRLVILLALAWMLPAAIASAESVRVKIGPANVYEHARVSSDVMMTVPEGTVLEVLRREGEWYWVMLPADGYGMRRSGYIPAYLVERQGDKRAVEPGIVGGASKPGLPGSLRPKFGGPVRASTRFHVGIGGGGQFGSASFKDQSTFRSYGEIGQLDAAYSTPGASSVDVNIGLRVAPQVVIAFDFWRTTPVPVANVTSRVPHPYEPLKPRTTFTSGVRAGRDEDALHVQVTYIAPLNRRADLAIFAGPSVFYLRQDLVNEPRSPITEGSYPFDSVTIDSNGFVLPRKSKAVIGAHIGADLTVMVWRFVGLGIGGRYARGAMNLPSAGGGSIPVDVGGTQLSGGLRLRF